MSNERVAAIASGQAYVHYESGMGGDHYVKPSEVQRLAMEVLELRLEVERLQREVQRHREAFHKCPACGIISDDPFPMFSPAPPALGGDE